MSTRRSPATVLLAALLGALVAIGAGGVLVATGALNSSSGGDAARSPSQSQPVVQRPSGGDNGQLSDLYDNVRDGVAFIEASSSGGGDQFAMPGQESGGGTATGSGFVVDKEGRIVTNAHVVEGSDTFRVRIGENDRFFDAQLVGSDPSTDLAVLKVDPGAAGDLHPLGLGSSGSVRVGEHVIAIGSPFGLQSTLTDGIVSALNRQIASPSGNPIDGAVQTDASINPGNSGGPLLDDDGRVIGVNAQIASQSGTSSGVGFAIPIDIVKKVIPALEAGGGATTDPNAVDPTDPSAGADPGAVDPSQVDPGEVDPTDPSAGGVDPSQVEPVDPTQGDPSSPFPEG